MKEDLLDSVLVAAVHAEEEERANPAMDTDYPHHEVVEIWKRKLKLEICRIFFDWS